MKLVASKSFEKKYKKIASKNPKLKQSIDKTLLLMEKDLYHPHLETHKLSGNLFGLWALSCGYDCRIIFSLEQSNHSNEQVIVLLDFGTHDKVY